MRRKLILLTSFVVVLGIAVGIWADITVPPNLTISDKQSHSEMAVKTGGTLTITNTGWLTITAAQQDDCSVDGGTLLVEGDFTCQGRCQLGNGAGGTIIMDGNSFTVKGGPFKMCDETGGLSKLYVRDGNMVCEDTLDFEYTRGGYIYIGGGVLLIKDPGDDDEENPEKWRSEGYLLPDVGYKEVTIQKNYPLTGNITITAVPWGPLAVNPYPEDEAEHVCPTALQLLWDPTDKWIQPEDLTHDVYVGTNFDDVNVATRGSHATMLYYSEDQDPNEYPADPNPPLTLDFGTTYYWRVDEVNNAGDPCVWHSYIVWEFTTDDGNAVYPSPPNGTKGYNPTNAVLRWTPSCIATAQTAYFSTSFNDVDTMNEDANEATLGPNDNNCPVGTLEKYMSYYWRIKTTGTGGGDGEVWRFKTGSGGILLEMLFDDGTQGNNLPATVTDTGDHSFEFTTYALIYDPNATGDANYGEPRFAVGGTPTSANFEPNAGLYRKDPCAPDETDLLRLDGYQYTIELWFKPDVVIAVDHRARLIYKSQYSWAIELDEEDKEIVFRHRGGTLGTESVLVADEWYHFTAIYDSTATTKQEVQIYLDGVFDDDEDANRPNPATDINGVSIGFRLRKAFPTDGNAIDGYLWDEFYDGLIDELRIWDIAIEPVLECASNPFPTDKYRPVEPNDANYAKLMWKPGKYVQSTQGHKIYFGTSIDDVNESAEPNATLDSNSWEHPQLELTRTYYWRVDEVNDGNVWTGPIWTFETRVQPVHPNLVVWYPLDETSGEEVGDYSGRYFEAKCEETPYWEPENGRFGGCMNFKMEWVWDPCDQEMDWEGNPGNIMADDGAKIAKLINKQISVSVWINADPNQRRDEDMVVFEFCDSDWGDDIAADANKTKVLAVVPTEPTDTGIVAFRAGLYPQDYLVYTEGDPLAWRGKWQHFVFIKNENDANMYIYHNAELVASNKNCNTASLVNVLGKDDDSVLQLGSYVENDDGYDGRIDNFQIYNIALTEDQIEEVFRCGALDVSCPGLALAWSPSPYDGQDNVYHKVDLTWEPGAYTDETDGHEVFFGTNYDEVFDANTTVHPNVVHDTCSTCFFDPPEDLNLGQTYYWRVDEVNEVPDACVYTGRIWSFTVADFFIIDDFEDYIDTDDVIANGWAKAGGPYFFLGLVDEDVEWFLQPRGWKSLFTKSSTYKATPPPTGASWMESKFELDPNDWTTEEMKLLTLWFYGDVRWHQVASVWKWSNPCTATERWWVELEDINNVKAKVWYPSADGNDFKAEEWISWEIPLKDFKDAEADLCLSKMLKIYIGTGTVGVPGENNRTIVYFDDIWLAPAYCVPSERKPQADMSGPYDVGVCDCLVDYYDLDYMSDQWLESDCNCIEEYGSMPAPPEANLVAWYKFDDGSGSEVNDSSTYNDDHGTIAVNDVNVFWVTGYGGSGYALEFDGGWAKVPDGGNTPQLRHTGAVTVCAWINRAEPVSQNVKLVVKGRNDKEPYALEIGKDDNLQWFARDPNEKNYELKGKRTLPIDAWVHVAGTYDGNCITSYVNAQLEVSEPNGGFQLYTDANDGLGIAARWKDPAYKDRFIGTIDDVRIYNYALSGAEICYIASGGDGVVELDNPANVFTNEPEGTEQAVNLKDFAKLMIEWLAEEQPLLWPE